MQWQVRSRPPTSAISTTAMMRVLQYEPADLTISVEAGMRWADLTSLLAEQAADDSPRSAIRAIGDGRRGGRGEHERTDGGGFTARRGTLLSA